MPSHTSALSAREILRLEYGASRNFMTPHVISRGKLARNVAYEISFGSGLEPGTSIYGVSVVRLHEDGTTERDHERSACFSTLERANEHVEYLRYLEQAEQEGYEAGKAAGSWLLDGNSTEQAARALLRGIEDGDPEVMDALPSSPLSGEWADDPLPRDVLDGLGLDEDDDAAEDVLRAYEDAYSRGVEDEAVRSARAMLGLDDEQLEHYIESTRYALTRDDVEHDRASGKNRYRP